jgi:hypothetical protein
MPAKWQTLSALISIKGHPSYAPSSTHARQVTVSKRAHTFDRLS